MKIMRIKSAAHSTNTLKYYFEIVDAVAATEVDVWAFWVFRFQQKTINFRMLHKNITTTITTKYRNNGNFNTKRIYCCGKTSKNPKALLLKSK